MATISSSFFRSNSFLSQRVTLSALITIPMGWVPSVFIPYGGVFFLNDASMVVDQTGFMTWEQQFMTLLNAAAPLIGFVLGDGLLGSTQGEQDFDNWVKHTFSQQLSS
jgi:hypothetical protein